MGKTAEKNDDADVIETEEVILDVEPQEEDPVELDTEDTGEEVSDEIEIVRENDTLSLKQQSLDGIIQKRVKKLNIKVDKATQQATDATTEAGLLREKNKILELAIEQQREAAVKPKAAPDPDDFDLGYEDPAYRNEQRKHTQAEISAEVQRQVAGVTKGFMQSNQADAVSKDLVKKQTGHYQNALKLGAKDYNEVEDAAIEILGQDVTNQLISNFDDSPTMLYYLGKNPAEAERLSNLIKTNPIKGVAEIGRLQVELKVKPKKTTDAPEPDEEIIGGKASSSENALKQLAKLRQKAASGDPEGMNNIRKYKKSLKDKGITL
tara:strand:+ start:31564 stop:32529 length:966 start_codon:yes stop_codon:yes gene_type:complete